MVQFLYKNTAYPVVYDNQHFIPKSLYSTKPGECEVMYTVYVC
jgi:hypothetical protein